MMKTTSFRRLISAVLAVMIVLSMCVTGLTVFAAEETETQTIYLKASSNWSKDNARFAMYVFNKNTSANAWVSMADNDADGYYEAATPAGEWTSLIFCRMNPSKTENNWENKWNQSLDLDFVSGKNCFNLNEGEWDKANGNWSLYQPVVPTEPTTIATVPTTSQTETTSTTSTSKQTVLGTFNNWDFSKAVEGHTTYRGYETEIYLEPGTYEFKFYVGSGVDGLWYGTTEDTTYTDILSTNTVSSDGDAKNFKYTVTEAGIYNFYYRGDTHSASVSKKEVPETTTSSSTTNTTTCTTTIAATTKQTVLGTFNDWDFSKAVEGHTTYRGYNTIIHLEPGTYEFKYYTGTATEGYWYGTNEDTVYTDTLSAKNVTISSDAKNFKFTVTTAGDYDFYYRVDTQTAAVSKVPTPSTTVTEPEKPESNIVWVYFTNTQKWSHVGAYVWNDTTKDAKYAWPGEYASYVTMDNDGNEVVSMSIDTAKYDSIIFNDGKGNNQTVDINNINSSIGIKPNGSYTDGKLNIDTYEVVEPSVTVPENEISLIRGQRYEIKPTATGLISYLITDTSVASISESGVITANSTGVSTVTVVAKGTYSLKSTTIKVNVVDTTVPPVTTVPTTEPTQPTTPAEPTDYSTYAIKGDITFALNKTDNAAIVENTISLPAGCTYGFNVVDTETDTRYGRTATYTDEISKALIGPDWGKCTLNTTGGDYKFTFNINNNKLTVTKVNNKNLSTYRVKGSFAVALEKTTSTIVENTVDLPAGSYRFVIMDDATSSKFGRAVDGYVNSIPKVLCGNNWGYLEMTVTEAGKFKVIYNTKTNNVTVVPVSANDSGYMVISNDFVLSLEKSKTEGVVEGTVKLEAGTYKLGVTADDGATTYGRDASYTDTMTRAELGLGWGKVTLKATGGNYKFTFNTKNNKLEFKKV